MSLTLIGKKIGMTQFYDANNTLVPVTVVEVGPCPVVQVKTSETDGYNAVQVGFSEQKEHRISNPLKGHFKKAGVAPLQYLREFRVEEGEYKVGDVLTVAKFAEGQKVDVIANTKGRGFQGVMKRWDFSGQGDSHGSMMHRRSGSIGMRQFPGHVFKNKRMPGHMGTRRRTTQNLEIVKIFEDKNLILLKGSVHGSKGGIVYIRTAKKVRKAS